MTIRAVLALLATSLCAPPALAADTLARVRDQGYFVWGADQEGGGPYVYPDPNGSGGLVGFEVDLAARLAVLLTARLGTEVTARFAQGPWDMLPELLRTERIDMVLNGYELTPERIQVMAATRPYYVYTLQLLARKDDATLSRWEAITAAHPVKIGILGGSAAERYLRARYTHDEVDVVSYDGNTNAMLDVVRGKLDATLADTPIARFYAKDFPALAAVGEPVAPGSYVLYLRPGDEAWRSALDAAIVKLAADGSLRQIYERYGIWTEEQARLGEAQAPQAVVAAATPGFFARHGLALVQAAAMTLLLSLASMPVAIVLGVLIALGRLFGPRLLRRPLKIYVEVLRGTPLLLQLLVIFYLLPAIGLNLHPVLAAIVGLAINYSAYEAEIYRAGLLAVPVGQMEAAAALGMSRVTALRRVVIPQAVRIVMPPVTNDFIALFKDTSVCSVVTVVELAKRYNIAVMNNPADILPLAAMTAVLYLVMSYPLSVLSRRMEIEASI
ncbi:MAG: ABC transporter permease subunit [Deltaproteobacteria bacterium]|nr:ABC transporter permease subunit [Deltaproteobacteria bacterium]